VTLKMPAFEWVHVQLHQQKGMISLSPPTICNSAGFVLWHSTWCIKGHKEGPLGPWLCLGHVLLLLDNLYQPLWVI
ncbi:hypothetical protein ACVUTW_22460, partial [Salmonella enterica subsp. enterica serovar Gallinarum]